MSTQRIPEYFSLLPSEICRFVLDYLLSSGFPTAATSLFAESDQLAELRAQYDSVLNLPLHITQLTLLDLIQDYLRIANIVAHYLSKLGIVCRLGAISSLVPHMFKSDSARPINVRPNWMPAGKSFLPPRVIKPELAPRKFQLPLLAVRPHFFSGVTASSCPIATNAQSRTCINVRLPSLSDSEPSNEYVRPMIRLYRRSSSRRCSPVPFNSDLQVYKFAKQSTQKPSTEVSAQSLEVVTTINETKLAMSTSPCEDKLDSVSKTPILELHVSKPVLSSAHTSHSFATNSADDAPATTDSTVLFDVLPHLPPPTRGDMPALEKRDWHSNQSDKSADTALSVNKKRRYNPPRHLSTVSRNSELSAPLSREVNDDLDLQRFLSALLSNPEQLVTHINAKMSGCPTKDGMGPSAASSIVGSTDLVPMSDTSQESHSYPRQPPSPAATVVESSLRAAALNHRSNTPWDKISVPVCPFAPSDPPNEWLNDHDLDICIDNLLLQLEGTKDDKPVDSCSQSSQTTSSHAPEVIDLMMPSRTSTPTATKGNESGLSAVDRISVSCSSSADLQFVGKRSIVRSLSPPLCLSELSRTFCSSPHSERQKENTKRRSLKKSSAAVLRTPENKVANVLIRDDPPRMCLLQKGALSNENTMQIYEEYVHHHRIHTTQVALDTSSSVQLSPVSTLDLDPIANSFPVTSGSVAMPLTMQLLCPGNVNAPSFWQTVPSERVSGCIYSCVAATRLYSTSSSFSSTKPTVLPHVSTLVPITNRGTIESNMDIENSIKPKRSYLSATTETSTSSTLASTQLISAQHCACAPTSPRKEHPSVEENKPASPTCDPSASTRFLDGEVSRKLTFTNTEPAIVQPFGRQFVIHLPSVSSDVGNGMPNVCLPACSDLSGVPMVVLPLNVDLDSPNPYRILSSSVRNDDKENRPPLVVHGKARRKVLNLESLDIDHILSQSR
ncbi:hypothetical protein EG68_05734 [Paragonimus skrjabini miyazakii]|uniref:LisH domain-containing protein n=1 Tax=Paragonimus skrjabini miyazakii TaxID=59628 RepID=A0A8S9YNI4_9TREM|nr:hypothetical protein EG68_05734 [Paragonimus skrjabini miyazakii]